MVTWSRLGLEKRDQGRLLAGGKMCADAEQLGLALETKQECEESQEV